MEAIGTLAGGIAHNFNNILSSILGFTELSLDEVEKGSGLHDNLNEVFMAGIRARDQVRQILTFSRQSDQKTAPMDMGTVIKEATALLRASIPTTVQMETEIPEKNFIIEGNTTQIHQVIINLCTNAAQAMEKAGGRLAVILERVELEVNDNAAGATSGKYVLLTVSDTGCGMAPDVTERIFDPYFTTRETGKGSGMAWRWFTAS
jgi:signal transduction histidine kinase